MLIIPVERFSLSHLDIEVMRYAHDSYVFDLHYYSDEDEEDQGWRTMYWLTHSEAPSHDGKRLYNIGVFECVYSDDAKEYFYRITPKGIEVLKALGYKPKKYKKEE